MHEADPEKAVEIFDSLLMGVKKTNISRIRRERQLSQSELAQQAGISIRSIQMFEQRKSDINHAQYNHLKAIANVLKCEIDELLER